MSGGGFGGPASPQSVSNPLVQFGNLFSNPANAGGGGEENKVANAAAAAQVS